VGTLSRDEPLSANIVAAAGQKDYLSQFGGKVSWSAEDQHGRNPVATALLTDVVQVIDDVTPESVMDPLGSQAVDFGFGTCIAIPFAPGGRKSVLVVYARPTFVSTQVRLQGLQDVAREVEVGVAHLESSRRLELALAGTLQSLGKVTEVRDPYTAGHQSEVGSLSAAIATHLGLDRKLITLIRQSGEVHDLGKVAIPSEILNKPGRLSALEFEIVKGHTTVGFEILSKASLPWPIAEVALQHHERLDGSGYPNGLRANEIIQPALIIAVADVVDAMTQHRPYRPGHGLDAALSEVGSGAGKLYDSDVVEACLAVFKNGFTFESHLVPEP
jgi:response regulator RpfG family c-di-GMP phosphodiesterase